MSQTLDFMVSVLQDPLPFRCGFPDDFDYVTTSKIQRLIRISQLKDSIDYSVPDDLSYCSFPPSPYKVNVIYDDTYNAVESLCYSYSPFIEDFDHYSHLLELFEVNQELLSLFALRSKSCKSSVFLA